MHLKPTHATALSPTVMWYPRPFRASSTVTTPTGYGGALMTEVGPNGAVTRPPGQVGILMVPARMVVVRDDRTK